MPDVLTGESLNLSNILNNPAAVFKARLSKNVIDLTIGTIALTDLTECDFPGYAPAPIVNPDCFETESDYRGEAVTDPLVWQASEALTVPQLITSCYVTIERNGNPPELLQFFPFDPAFVMDLPGRELARQIRFVSFDETATIPVNPYPGPVN